MKRIYNTETNQTIWKGEEYLVDGIATTVEPPLYLLTDVNYEIPNFDPSTCRVRKKPPFANLEAQEWVWQSWEIIELSEFDKRLAVRQVSRQNLKDAWDNLPYDYIRGPYRDKFFAANSLLDEGDDEAAIALIKYAQPSEAFSEEQLSIFNAVKSQMLAGILNLNNS